jgi:drug/metabolite transporter (DMT)-like permease
MWLALLGVHLIGLVGFNLLLRKSVLGKVDKMTLATIMQTGIAVPALVLLVLFPPNFSSFTAVDFILIACATALGITLQVTNVKALQYLEASVFSILYNLRIILTTVLGILFLGESTELLRILGGVIILLAIVTVKQRSSRTNNSKGVWWAIAAVFALSFLNLTEKTLINSIGFLEYFPIAAVLAAAIMWGYLVASKRKVDTKLLLQPKMLQLMTLRALSGYGFSLALAAGALISVANYISGMGVIFTVLLGVIWLRERDYLFRKILATVVAVIGLTLVLLSGI